MTDAAYDDGEQVGDSWTAVFKSLSAEPRRQLLTSLSDAPPDRSIPLPESAATSARPSDPETLRLQLYHTHLPMLAEMGFVTWDADPLVASRGPRFDEVSAVFDALRSAADELPDSLATECQRLEAEQRDGATS